MSLKDIFYLVLWQPLCSVEWNHLCNFEFGPVVQEEMLFNNISYLELWAPLCSAEQNQLCNSGRRYQEEQFCEIILNLDQ